MKLDDVVIALSHICVIDGTGQPARKDQTLVIRDGVIVAIGEAISTPIPPGAKVLDLPVTRLYPAWSGCMITCSIPSP